MAGTSAGAHANLSPRCLIYMSGDSSGEWVSQGVPDSVMIPKPYALAQVITAILQLVTAAATASQ
jgi:hypothetical protein